MTEPIGNTEQLTREQILAMPAGRELDALVAKNVFDWQVGSDGRVKSRDSFIIRSLPEYSTDLYASWVVVEKFGPAGFTLIFDTENWLAETCRPDSEIVSAISPTAPEAISKCALLAVMEL